MTEHAPSHAFLPDGKQQQVLVTFSDIVLATAKLWSEAASSLTNPATQKFMLFHLSMF